MVRFLRVAAAVAAMGMSTVAMAQDADGDAFRGFYVGGSFGGSLQPNDTSETILFDTDLDGDYGDVVRTGAGADAFSPGFCNGASLDATGATPCANDKDGIEYYGRVGYDGRTGRFVVGVLGEFGKSEAVDAVSGFSTTPASYRMVRQFDWNASIRGRVGYVAGDSTLFYGAFGPAYGRIDSSFATTNGANEFVGRGKRNSWGFTGGGGIEQQVTDNLFFGLEYLYNQYQDDDYRVRATTGTAPPTNPFLLVNPDGTDFRRSDNNFRFHSMRVTAGFRF